MLYTNTVHEGTLAILNELMVIEELAAFSLVGGTALALKFGHRISEDIDLFSETDFDKTTIQAALQKKFGKRFIYEERGNPLGIFCFIEDIKLDLVKHKFPLIRPLCVENGIRFYSTEDITAMKIATILRRAKKKDFWDIAELLNHYSVDNFIHFFFEKFPEQMLLISIPQAMTYFTEAASDEDPKTLNGQTWESVKKIISKSVKEYLK